MYFVCSFVVIVSAYICLHKLSHSSCKSYTYIIISVIISSLDALMEYWWSFCLFRIWISTIRIINWSSLHLYAYQSATTRLCIWQSNSQITAANSIIVFPVLYSYVYFVTNNPIAKPEMEVHIPVVSVIYMAVYRRLKLRSIYVPVEVYFIYCERLKWIAFTTPI